MSDDLKILDEVSSALLLLVSVRLIFLKYIMMQHQEIDQLEIKMKAAKKDMEKLY
jgi:hypothetical protein